MQGKKYWIIYSYIINTHEHLKYVCVPANVHMYVYVLL